MLIRKSDMRKLHTASVKSSSTLFLVQYVQCIILLDTILFHYLCCRCLCVSSFREFPVFTISCLIPDFYAKITCYLGVYVRYCAWWAMGAEGGESPVWLVGICSLVHGVNQACSLTCQTNSRFHIPAWIPFLQGTGEPSSADHLWVGPRNGDCDAYIYPPLYLQKGFFPFICHEYTQVG